jgi:phosphoglycolate phosphatase-like HAD superfamily hydrolase
MGEPRPVRLLIFDNNGTMLDDLHLAYACSEAMFSLLRVPRQSADRFRQEGANDVSAFCLRHGVPASVTHEELDIIRRLYYSARMDQVRPRQGLGLALDRCAEFGILAAVCSAENSAMLDDLLMRFELRHRFVAVRGEARPKGPALSELIASLAVAPDEAAYVDDTVDGIRAAQEYGSQTIAFAHPTSYCFSAHLWACKPNHVVGDFAELRRLIPKLAQRS